MDPDEKLAVRLVLELVPAAAFAASIAFAVSAVTRQPLEIGAPAAAGAAAFLVALGGLRRFGPGEPRFALPPFEAEVPEPIGLAESCSEPAPVVEGEPASEPDELLLEDVYAGPSRDSQVVRLFDPAAIPSAGELRARIDRHLETPAPPVAYSDATRELHDALDALRRALR